VKVNINTLGSSCFSTNLHGDLITLIQAKLGLSFSSTISKIADMIGFKSSEKTETFTPPFGGFYRKISRLRNEDDIEIQTYSDDILLDYKSIPNMLFYKDGISTDVQLQYEIGYDCMSGRISVPWRSFDGSVVGVMGRLNKLKTSEDEKKWFPIQSFAKSKTIYGYSNNYNTIQEKGIVMVGESEKHTLQISSKGMDVGISLGGTSMSEVQANHIKSLFVKTNLIMFDEGLSEEISRDIAMKLKLDKFFKNNVMYIYDKNNMYMPKGSKLSPSDLDRNTLKKLIENCAKKI